MAKTPSSKRGPILSSKVAEPRMVDVLPRRRLFRQLDAARQRPIVWISAPAGAGKTTLVASYLSARKLTPLWYRVDEGDHDPARLFEHLSVATRHLARGRRIRLPAFGPMFQPGLSAFARRYFEQLFAELPPRTVLVFDNYQEVAADSPWHELVCRNLAALPRGMTAILISRTDPPAALARQVANGEVELLGWNDLRLTAEETRALTRRHTRSRGSATAASTIHAVTGGWAAAIVLLLARGRARGTTAPSDIDEASSGVFDYLASEIFDRLDAPTRRLLLRISVLPFATESMGAELSGVEHAGRTLRRLARENFFVERQESAGVAYRFHPLFRAFLLDRAARELGPEGLREVQREAAAVLTIQGHAEDALELLRQAGDVEASIGLILREAPRLVAQGRTATLEAWLAALPAAVVSGSGWLSFWRAACCSGYAPDTSLELFSSAFDAFQSDGGGADRFGAHLAWSGAVQSISHRGVDYTELDRWIGRLSELDAGAPLPPEIASRVATAMVTARTNRAPGGAEARAWAERALKLARESGDLDHRLMTGGLLVIYHCFFGSLGHAAAVLEEMRASRRRDASEPIGRVTTDVAAALHTWVAGEMARCRSAVTEGLEIADATGVVVWNDQFCSLGVAVELSSGDVEAARPYLDRLAQGASRSRFALGSYHFYAGWDALLRKDWPRAERCAKVALEEAGPLGSPFALALAHAAIAQVAIARGRDGDAAEHLGEARRLASEMGSRLVLHGILLMEADLALSRGAVQQALGPLREGFAEAREAGIYNMFWMTPATVSRLSVAAVEHEIEADYVRELVRRRDVQPDPPPVELASWPWAVKIFTLGRFALERSVSPGGSPSKGQIPLRLLKAIVAAGGRDVPESTLSSALWPDADGDAARKAFDTTLHRLRKLLGGEPILELHGGNVHLDARRVWIDVWALEHCLARIERATAEPGGLMDVEVLGRRLLALHRGSFLPGDDLSLVVRAREHTARRVLRALSALGRHLEADERTERALELYTSGLDIDDRMEPLYQGVMRCLLRLGRRAEALLAYDRCRDVLGSSLGVRPSEATESIRAEATMLPAGKATSRAVRGL